MSLPDAAPPALADTLRALVHPRRAVPILLVSVPLVVIQDSLSAPAESWLIGALMCGVFLLVAPHLWRALGAAGRVGGLLAYAVLGLLVVAGVGVLVPAVLDVGPTFLTRPESLAVSAAMFWVGGWGLGRDIDLEADLHRSQARARVLAREAERARLLALRSHLDPHFLFNTLNAIAEWCHDDPRVAETALLRLSGMLRVVLEGTRARAWSLGRELALVEDLFELHGTRDPLRFRASIDVPDELRELPVPPLLLLLLAENAMKHGPGGGHEGEVTLRARRAGGQAFIELDNPGAFAGEREGGEGLPMVRRRLALAYGGEARFRIAAWGSRTLATLELPLVPRELGAA